MRVKQHPVFLLTAAALVAGTCMLAAPADAHGPQRASEADLATTAADYTPDAMFAVEAQVLGTAHAREHLAQRNLTKRLAAQGKLGLLVATPTVTGAADSVGAWSAPFVPPASSVDAIGVHAILLHTGKVLLFGGYFDAGDNTLATDAFLFDPADGSAKEVDPPHNTFCAGQVLLQDGTLLVVGGRLANTHPTPGTPYVLRFDPVSETWLPEPDTALGRYYPTTTELPDGRVLVTTGNMTTGRLNRTVEVFTPGTGGAMGSFTTVGTNVVLDLYPKQYVMPDGKVFVVQHKLVSLLDPASWTWTKLAQLTVPRKTNPGSAQLPAAPGLGQNKIFMAGGASTQRGETTDTTELFDESDPLAGWKPMASMPNPRTHMNVVYLPDGTLLGVGGNSFDRFGTPQTSALLYDPAANTWTTLASQALRRAYHSTALLLPDGRVLSAGDTGPGGGGTRLEIFSPPYLFKGPRPVVTATSATQLDFGAGLSITTDPAAGPAPARVVLIHPSAVTHANDMSGRFVDLVVTSAGPASIHAVMPANANLAQPGYYMAFVLDANNVPSVATWVHLGPMTYGG